MTDPRDTDRDRTSDRPTTGRVITSAGLLDAPLPADLAASLGRLLGQDPVDTLGEWTDAVRRATGGGSIGVDDLCHVDRESGHWGVLDGERYDFACFYDAVLLAAIVDEPVEVHTVSPAGTPIRGRATGSGELAVTPGSAVFSFGVARAVERPPDPGPTPATVYGAVCPYVRAFPNPDAYRRWADGVPAATVAMPLGGARDLAAGLVE